MPEFKVGQKVFVYQYHSGKKQTISLEQAVEINKILNLGVRSIENGEEV